MVKRIIKSTIDFTIFSSAVTVNPFNQYLIF